MEALGIPPFHTLEPVKMRELMTQMRPDVPVEPVDHVEDLRVPGPGGEIPVRIYCVEENCGSSRGISRSSRKRSTPGNTARRKPKTLQAVMCSSRRSA